MYAAVIVGAGQGRRTNLSFNKIFYKFEDKVLIEYTLKPFLDDPQFKEIVLVVSQNDMPEIRKIIKDPKVKIVPGGASRQESVHEGLKEVSSEIVFIHDGARPNINTLFLEKCKKGIEVCDAITLAVPIKDTLKAIKDGFMQETIDRDSTVRLQTPQVFRTAEIKEAHESARLSDRRYTDDATLYASELGKNVCVIPGDEYNIKATTMIDLLVLEEILCIK